MKSYKLDLATKTLTITKEFEEAYETGDEAICELYTRLTRDIKGLKVVRRTHKTPSSYHTKSGEVYNTNQFKNLTYEHMEAFIKSIRNSQELLSEYNFLKNVAAGVQTNGYTLVRKWFVAQFPLYRKNPLFYLQNEVKPIDMQEFMEKGIKPAATESMKVVA